jgi:heme/copper-type cytochrome/quinol oxidase subunit 3
MSPPTHPDLIVGFVLGVIFIVGLIFVFVKAMEGRERPASIAIFIGAYFMTIGVGLALLFIISHFILKHW